MYDIQNSVNYIEKAMDERFKAGLIEDFSDMEGELLNLIMAETDEIAKMMYKDTIDTFQERYAL